MGQSSKEICDQFLDEKKKVLSLQQTGKEVTLPTSSNSEKNSVERVDAPDPLLVAAASGNKEDTKTMLPGTLTSKISKQLGTTTTSSTIPVHIDVEAQNNVDNNSRQLIVTSQVATEQLSSRFVKDRELESPNAVVVTKSRQDVAKKGNTTAEKYSNQWTLVSHKETIEQTGKLKQCCHDEHTNQQALVTHEKEFIVTEKIDGKEINLNTPTLFILDQEVATNNLNETKEKRGGESASRWADLVEEENHTPSPSRSKLSPQALEFVPTSKTNPSMAVIGTSSNLSATKVNVADRDILYDLDCNTPYPKQTKNADFEKLQVQPTVATHGP
ncbi:hypothetical protein KY285_023061 [Solanum tuberosum]|nr:hypothetical protein KY285_023061 [Solanum tuberosum]